MVTQDAAHRAIPYYAHRTPSKASTMTNTNFVVPHHGFGDPCRLSVHNINPEVFLSMFEEADTSHLIPVTLCGHSSSGFRVRHDDTVVGTISVDQSHPYSELDWIIAAGLRPQVMASISMCRNCADDGDDTVPYFDVLLPPPGLCVPSNNPPEQRWGLLDGDAALRTTDFTIPAKELPDHADHVLVTLKNRWHLFLRSVQVFVDNALVATIPHNKAGWLADTIAGYNHEGLIAVARAYYAVEDGTPSLTIYASESNAPSTLALGSAGVLTAATVGMTELATARAKAAAASPAPDAPETTTSTAPSSATTSTASGTTSGAAATATPSSALGSAAAAGAQLAATSTGLKLALSLIHI